MANTMSTIMVPHDGTEMSDRALDRAGELARALHSEILVVHIVDSRFVPPSATLGFINDKTTLEDAKTKLVKILKSGAELMLKQKMERLKASGISVRFLLGVGSPADEIVSIAKAEKVGLIVMGSRQLTKEKHIPLGSVARKVSETGPCSVMILH